MFTVYRLLFTVMDALGHVNNAVYQNYLEQAAVEHSEYLGLTLNVYQELGGVFVMRRVEIDYLRPAVAGDTLEVTTWLKDMRGTRALRRYEIRKHNQQNLLVTAEALWVWVDAKIMRPRPIPNVMLDKFLQIQHSDIGR
ncbi:acyl-CoA thioesterase [Komarekiella delphini-convector]|nr:thioesterase family protein [Komarekiella delphini-convector]